MQTTTSQQHKDEYLKKLSDLKEEITNAYTKGKRSSLNTKNKSDCGGMKNSNLNL